MFCDRTFYFNLQNPSSNTSKSESGGKSCGFEFNNLIRLRRIASVMISMKNTMMHEPVQPIRFWFDVPLLCPGLEKADQYITCRENCTKTRRQYLHWCHISKTCQPKPHATARVLSSTTMAWFCPLLTQENGLCRAILAGCNLYQPDKLLGSCSTKPCPYLAPYQPTEDITMWCSVWQYPGCISSKKANKVHSIIIATSEPNSAHKYNSCTAKRGRRGVN